MSAVEGRNPYEDYVLINKELEEFNPKLLKKPQIIIANKMDLENSKENLDEFKKKLNNNDIKILEVSAATNTGLTEVLDFLADLLDKIPDQPLFEDEAFESHVLYKFKKEEPYTIEKIEDDLWEIKGKEIEKIFSDFKVDDVIIPVEHLKYKGPLKTYVIWTILSELPGLNGNDDDLYSVIQIDFDVYSDSNYLNIVKKIKELMKENMWLWVEDSSEMQEEDTKLYHKTITFEKERMI